MRFFLSAVGFALWSLSDFFIASWLSAPAIEVQTPRLFLLNFYMSACAAVSLVVLVVGPKMGSAGCKSLLGAGSFLLCAIGWTACLLSGGSGVLAGIALYAAGSTLLLFCYLELFMLLPTADRIKAFLVNLVIVSAVLILAKAVSVDWYIAAFISVLLGSALLLVLGRKVPMQADSVRSVKVDKRSLGRAYLGVLAISFTVACVQNIAFQTDGSESVYLGAVNLASAALLGILMCAFKDIDFTVSIKIIVSLALVSMLVVAYDSRFAYGSYLLISISYTTLTHYLYYVSTIVARTHPRERFRIFAAVQFALSLSSPLLVALSFIGADTADPALLYVLFLVLALCAVWLLNDRVLDRLLEFEPECREKDPSGFSGAATRLAEECGLTRRERDVYQLYIVGRSAPFIAEKLTISENTVKSHLQRVYSKCGVHSRQELISCIERIERDGR